MPTTTASRRTSADRSRRLDQNQLFARGAVLTVLATVCFTAEASAQNSELHGHVSTTFVSNIAQTFTNVPSATLSGLTAADLHGNDGTANGSISTPDGRFAISSHAFSGGAPGNAGQAIGDARASTIRDYLIVSSTLPAGTPVSVLVNWAVKSRVTALGENMGGVNTGALGIASGQVAIYPNYEIAVNKPGGFSLSRSPSGTQAITSGTLDVKSDFASSVFTVNVGQVMRVLFSIEAGSNSSVESGSTDGDVQMAMVWGVTSQNAAASAVLLSNQSEPAPPAAAATPAAALALLPPRPASGLACFTVSTQPESVYVCGPANATFSTAATGTGPFFYQWRRNGVPLDNNLFPSATNPTLSLTNVSSGDAGSYDCVISTSCGDMVSNAAPLTVCVLSAEGESTPRVTRLAAARPAPFHASTTLEFELARAGVARLEVFDLRGARVRTLASGWHEAGHADVVWNGEDDAGHRLPAGVYLVRLQAVGFTGTQRIVKMQ